MILQGARWLLRLKGAILIVLDGSEIHDLKFETVGGHSSVHNDPHEPTSGILSLLSNICLVGHNFN